MTASRILDRLARVKQTRPGSWMAACPCCESRRGRPLAVSETSDGRVLIYAFCGCSTEDVLGRVGLTINDLFDKPLEHTKSTSHFKLQSSEVLAAVSMEATVLAVLASDFLTHRYLSDSDWNRLAATVSRLTDASDYANGRMK